MSQRFAVGEFLSFINACGIDPPGRQSRSNAKAFVLRQKKETKDKAVEQLWAALAGPEGIKAKLLQKATPDRSKVRNKINGLRRWGNSVPGRHTTSVGGLRHSPV